MTGTYLSFSVDIGAGFDDDIDAGSMAILSGLHKGGEAILHSRDMIRGGQMVLSHISDSSRNRSDRHMKVTAYARSPLRFARITSTAHVWAAQGPHGPPRSHV